MKFTLLEGVQEVLSAMDSDEVTSINDTAESLQVAMIFRSVYFDIINDLDLPEYKETFNLEELDDDPEEVFKRLQDNMVKLHCIKYDKRMVNDLAADYQEICYLPFKEFVERQNTLRTLENNVDDIELKDNVGEVLYRSDMHPQYYTMVDGLLLFDSYDESVNPNGVDVAKTLCYGSVNPTFELSDEFIPALDAQQFRYWLHRAKTRAFLELKQMPHPEAAGEARRQKIMTQKRKNRITESNRPPIPNYGRK